MGVDGLWWISVIYNNSFVSGFFFKSQNLFPCLYFYETCMVNVDKVLHEAAGPAFTSRARREVTLHTLSLAASSS